MLLSAAAHLMEPPQVGAAASCASTTSGTNVRLRSGVKRLKSTLDAVGATQALRTDARRRRGVRYRHYDFDGDVDLDWEEFYSIQPRKIREQHSAASIRKWFNAMYAASGKPGVASVNDFFMFTLSARASEQGAGSLGAALKRYDTTPAYAVTGDLDRAEFAVVCETMGFGSDAQVEHIFRSLDKDGKLAQHPAIEPREAAAAAAHQHRYR